jgi:hypothetical protein
MGILRAAENATVLRAGNRPQLVGSMCPSYRATLNEKILHGLKTVTRIFNPFREKTIIRNCMTFELCELKACASECPSNVDVAA